MLNGLLLVNKVKGPTSHDVVELARKVLDQPKVGHTGTLDPLATGLLLLCVGRATRLQGYMLDWEKEYRGVIKLGQATDTYDATGKPVEPAGEVPELDDQLLRSLEREFSGELEQVPPPFSAKKVGGKKLYELARKGKAVEAEPKRVRVLSLNFERVDEFRIGFMVRCSSGFYVRSLAHDIGLKLGCGAHLEQLERTAIGPYRLERAVPQEELEGLGPRDIVGMECWVPLDKIKLPYPELELNPTAAQRFCHGSEVVVLRTGDRALLPGDMVVARTRRGTLLGVGVVSAVMARGRTVAFGPRTVIRHP